jgi:hypothetical protein
MEFWLIVIPIVVIYKSYLLITEWLETKKNIASLPLLEEKVLALEKMEQKLQDDLKKIPHNIGMFRRWEEDDKQRKIYFSQQQKRNS